MNFLKSILLTLLVLIGTIVGYSYFKFNTQFALTKACGSYKEGNYNSAADFLSAINNHKKPQFIFYNGYLERAKGNLDTSSEYFKKDSKVKAEEKMFNLCLNAYLKEDFSTLDELLLNQNDRSTLSSLFKGLSAYHQKNYSEAKKNLDSLRPIHFSSKWMEHDWNQYFNREKIGFYLAHSLIETNEAFRGRQEIESLLTNEKNPNPQLLYLLGLSYLKEAKQRSIKLSIPYYQTAFTYFKRLPFSEPDYFERKEKVRLSYEELLSSLLKNSLYDELGLFLDIISYLDGSVEKVSSLFIQYFRKEVSSSNKKQLLKLTNQMLVFCHHQKFRENIRQSLYFYIQNLIENRDIDEANYVWPVYRQISFSLDEDENTVSKLLIEIFEGLVETDDEKLIKSKAVLKLLFSLHSKEGALSQITLRMQDTWQKDISKAWNLTQYINHLITDTEKETFCKKMIETLEEMKSDHSKENSPSLEIIERATQYLQIPSDIKL